MKRIIAKIYDIPEGSGIVVIGPEGQKIALFKLNSKIYALDNACPHEGGPLGEGIIEDCAVTCPWHGWQFNLETGECINMPGDDAVHYNVHVEGDDIVLNE